MSAKFFSGHGEEAKKKKGEGEEIEVAIRVNKKAIERTLYLTTIVVLIGVVIFMSINNNNCTSTAGAVTVEPESTGEEAKITSSLPEVTEPVVVEPTEPVDPPEAEPVTVVKTEIDAGLRFAEEDITTEGEHPSIKVTEVEYKVVSAGAKFTARVELRWYDKDEDEISKEVIHVTDEFIINQDTTVSRTMDSFTSRYLNSENDDEIFVLKLYDATNDKELDSEVVTFSP